MRLESIVAVLLVASCASPTPPEPVIVPTSPADGFVSYWSTRLEERDPSPATWRELCGALDGWTTLSKEHVARLDDALRAWPDELRRAPDRWGALDAPVDRPVWALVRAIDAAPDDAEALAGSLPHLEPVTWVTIDGAAPMAALATSNSLPNLAHVRSLATDLTALRSLLERRGGRLVTLDLWENELGPALTEVLARASVPRLELLDVGANRLDAASARRLADVDLARLREIVLAFNLVGDEGFAAALRAAPNLESVDARATGTTSRAIVAVEQLGVLRAVDLSDNALGDDRLERLGAATRRGVRALRLNHVGATPAGITALVGQLDGRLEVLELSRNELGDAGVKPLCTPGARALQFLKLDAVRMGNDGVRAIALCPHLAELRSLSIHTNGDIDATGVATLAGAKLPHLYAFGMDGCSVGDAGFAALANATWWSQLTHLQIEGNGFTDAIAPLFVAPPKLQNLGLGWNELRSPSAAALAAQPMPRLTTLSLRGSAFDDPALRALAAARWLGQLEELDLRSLAFDGLGLALDAIAARLPAHARLLRD